MKNGKLRVAVVIRPDVQDKYIASYILEKFNVVGIFVEPQYKSKSLKKVKSRLSQKLIENILNPVQLIRMFRDKLYYKKYMQRVSDVYQEKFRERGHLFDAYKDCPVYFTEYRAVSSADNVELLRKLDVDVVAVCGCSILKKNFLEVPPLGTINLHSGLAPYYRGCSCYFWPLYNNEPEYVGVTIHYVNPGIDDGDVIHQGRPDIQADDDEITIFVKMMEIGAKLMVKSLHEIEKGTVKGHKQTEKGQLYLDNMTTVTHIKELHEKLKKGLLKEYVAKHESGGGKPNIIE